MFAPVYAAAMLRGIAPAVLDESPCHVVAWAIEYRFDQEENIGTPETAEDLMAAYLEREALAAEGRLDEFYRPDSVSAGVNWR